MTKIARKQNQVAPVRNPFHGLFPASLFDDWFDRTLTQSNSPMQQFVQTSMDISETDQAFEITVDLPGVNEDEVEILLEEHTLTIRGQRTHESEEKNPDKKFHRVERFSGEFSRSVVLPNAINEDEAAAEFKDGVLKIVIPKKEEAKSKKINIKSNK